MSKGHSRIFGRGRRRSGVGLLVIAAAWTSLAWAAMGCGDRGEESRLAAATTPATSEPGSPAVSTPAPAESVSLTEPVRPEDTVPAVPAEVTYGDAEKVYRSGKYHDAMELFSVFALRHPDNAWGHYMLGLAAWKAGELERAQTALERSVELSPKHVKGLINLARVLLDRDKAVEALERVEKAVELEPESADAWRVMGNALSEMGENDEAIEAYRHALAIDGDDVWSMNNLGLVLIRQGRYEEALPPLARATELASGVAVFQNNLGVALERSGYIAESREAYRAALTASPEYAKAKISLARVESVKATQRPTPLDLPALARAFADDVARWNEFAAHHEDTTATPGSELMTPDSTRRPVVRY